ncbi:peptidoglycan-binding domain-containing protein [Streptomyces sp. NPDC048324]|uniref:peptidoglycan-binding domain-containing protein n=1 Tax=Streptomyces sp. NPDC048324 TaxID=3157205 RepID=UPI00342F133A
MQTFKRAALVVATAVIGTGIAFAPSATASPKVGNISVGSSNHHGVWCVQAGINAHYGKKVVDTDGKFGSDTRKAVRKYQSNEGLPVDGIVGPQTGSHLWADNSYSDYCYKYLPTTY